MFAVIKFAGAQHIVKKNDIITVNSVNAEVGDEITVTDVLSLINGDEVTIGTPLVENKKVTLKLLNNFKGEKVIIFKKRRRKHSKRKNGHRQHLTKLQVVDIA